MDCFVRALALAGIRIPDDLSIPDNIDIGEIPAICERLNLRWYKEGMVEIGVGPIIALCQISQISERTGHAVFVSDIGLLLGIEGIKILGLIGLENDRNDT